MSRWIDADALIDEVDGALTDSIAEHYAIEKINEAPSIDIVRCKDCVKWEDSPWMCKQWHVGTPDDAYCYMGIRKRAEQTEPKGEADD